MVGNKAQKAVAAALTGVLTLGAAAPALAAVPVPNKAAGVTAAWNRVDGTVNADLGVAGTTGPGGRITTDGEDRYDTMIDAVLTNAGFMDATALDGSPANVDVWKPYDGTDGVKDVVIASGDVYADALAANSLAGYYNAPIILTKGGALTPEGEVLIAAYAGACVANGEKLNAYIVGGEGSVSKATEKMLDKIANVRTQRIDGEDRQETSLELAAYERNIDLTKAAAGTFISNKTIIIANGSIPWDALSASSLAYLYNSSILLTDEAGNLTQDQIDWINGNRQTASNPDGIKKVYIVGGPSSVSASVVDTLSSSIDKVERLFGADRYATSARVATETMQNVADLPTDKDGVGATAVDFRKVAVATGKNFPDALVGAAFIGRRGGILVLADEGQSAAANAVKARLVANGVSLDEGWVMGGTSVFSDSVARQMALWFA